MKSFKYISIILTIITLSCEKYPDISVPSEEPKLVVNSLFTPDSIWSVKVSYSQGIRNFDAIQYEPDAEVKLFDSKNELIETLSYKSDGIYQSKTLKPLQGEKYSVKVESNDKKVLADSYAPYPVQISDLKISKDKSMDESYNKQEDYILFNFTLNDDADTDNYYIAMFEYRHTLYDDRLPDNWVIKPSDMSLEGNDNIFEVFQNKSWIFNRVLFTDELFNGQQKEIKLKTKAKRLSAPGKYTKISLKVYTCSKSMYRYLKSYYYQLSGDSYQSAYNPVTVESNIENGFGVFGGYSVSNLIIDNDRLTKVLEGK